jgi:hypothetical protein
MIFVLCVYRHEPSQTLKKSILLQRCTANSIMGGIPVLKLKKKK